MQINYLFSFVFLHKNANERTDKLTQKNGGKQVRVAVQSDRGQESKPFYRINDHLALWKSNVPRNNGIKMKM